MPTRKPSPLKKPSKTLLCLGIEGSANKLGCGVISHTPSPAGSSRATTVTVLSNVRHTYITPPGEGFLPSDTARHHREWVVRVVEEAVKKAGVWMGDLDCIAFTKGECVCSFDSVTWSSERISEWSMGTIHGDQVNAAD